MKKIPKRPVERPGDHAGERPRVYIGGGGSTRGTACRTHRPRGSRSIGPPSQRERVDMAFLAALMHLPDQRARGFASDALVRRVDLRSAASEVVKAAARVEWDDPRTLGMLADYAENGFTEKEVKADNNRRPENGRNERGC